MLGPKWADDVFGAIGKLVAVVVVIALLVGIAIGVAA